MYVNNRFQFHKGTIRTTKAVLKAAEKSYFNSIKVRLELRVLCRQFSQFVVFQFHKGTIRTRGDVPMVDENGYFNSIKVRLERIHL